MQTLPVYTDFQSIAALRDTNGASETDRLKGVAQQFSAVFTHMMLKSMRQASLGDGIFDSDQSHFYRDMFDQQLALELSGKEGVGFTGLLMDHLNQLTGTTTAASDGQTPENALMPNTTSTPIGPPAKPVNTGQRQAAEYQSVQGLSQEFNAPADKVSSHNVAWPAK